MLKRLHSNKPTAFEPSEILNVLDERATYLCAAIAACGSGWLQYYMCSEGEVMQAALPSHLKLSSESILTFNEEYGEDFSDLNDEEYLVAEALLLKKELKLSEVQQILDAAHVYPIIKEPD